MLFTAEEIKRISHGNPDDIATFISVQSPGDFVVHTISLMEAHAVWR